MFGGLTGCLDDFGCAQTVGSLNLGLIPILLTYFERGALSEVGPVEGEESMGHLLSLEAQLILLWHCS